MVVLLILLCIGGLLAALLIFRSGHPSWQVLPFIGWLGCFLVIGSYIGLPWLKLGSAGVLEQNAGWVIAQTDLLQELRKNPFFENAIPQMEPISTEDIFALLKHPELISSLRSLSASNQPVNGVRLLELVFRVQLFLALTLCLSLIIPIICALLNLQRLVTSQYETTKFLSRVISALSVIMLLLLLGHVSSLETLGKTNDLGLRLIMALAEAKVSYGFWVTITGLALCAASGLGDWFPFLAPWGNIWDEADEQGWED